MYADRVEAAPKRSVKDRLNGGGSVDNIIRRRSTLSGKRQRQDDDKWEHDLYDDKERQVSSRKVNTSDLRLKLRKNSVHANPRKEVSLSGVRDLRDKLSGFTHSQQPNSPAPITKPAVEPRKPSKEIVPAEASPVETKKPTGGDPKKKKKKAESVDGFLQSLGLEKYSITFQAEEVDMTALLHMTEDDLKALGIPMGPRKKIQTALESRI